MKSIRNAFHMVTDFGNLVEAHRKARYCKRGQRNVINFEMNLTYNLYRLKYELENKTYTLGEYNVFFISEPKRREIMSIGYPARVVMHSLCDNVLAPFIDKRLDYDNAACRPGRGTHFALGRLKTFLQGAYHKWGQDFYILKCDISKYFYSIRHDVLKKYLYKYIEDEDIKWLLDVIIDSTEGNIGLPIGNMTSQWFAVFYLDAMDKFVRHELKPPYYTRYMDDFLLIHNDKAYLKECLARLKGFLDRELGLKLNAKTQMFPAKNGVDYVGFHTYLTRTGGIIRKLRRRSVTAMKRRIKTFNIRYAKGQMDFKNVQSSVNSWIGHARYANSYRIRTKVLERLRLVRNSAPEA